MIKIRRSHERGFFDHGWLKTYHTFSFGDYHDPLHMGFRTLRVINEDTIQAGEGFPTHSHRDMEILTYVTSGSLEHKDSMGNTSVIRPGEVQRMSAGTGVTHSEFNPSGKEQTHLLQIWVLPSHHGLQPSYEQKTLGVANSRNQFRLIASPGGSDGSVKLNQDILIYDLNLERDKCVTYQVKHQRGIWVQIIKGTVLFEDFLLEAGDGAAISKDKTIKIKAERDASLLLFDSV